MDAKSYPKLTIKSFDYELELRVLWTADDSRFTNGVLERN